MAGVRMLVYEKEYGKREKVQVQSRGVGPRTLCVSMPSYPAHSCVDALRT